MTDIDIVLNVIFYGFIITAGAVSLYRRKFSDHKSGSIVNKENEVTEALRKDRNTLYNDKRSLTVEKDKLQQELRDIKEERSKLRNENNKLEQKLRDISFNETSSKREIQELKRLLEVEKKEKLALSISHTRLASENLELKTQALAFQGESNIPSISNGNNNISSTSNRKAGEQLKAQGDHNNTVYDQEHSRREHELNQKKLSDLVENENWKLPVVEHKPLPTVKNAIQEQKAKASSADTEGRKSIRVAVSPEKYQEIMKITREVEEELKRKKQREELSREATIKIEREWKISKNPFCESSSADGFAYNCMLWYFPKRIESTDPRIQLNRQYVYDFKEGKNTGSVAEVVAKALKQRYWHELNSGVFMVIPASTQSKNERRFKMFCQMVSSKTNLINGFNAISVEHDREALKGKINTSRTSNLSYNPRLFRDKTVFLFDDVMTTGSSFVQNAKELQKRGAKTVIGLFLARTVSDNSKINFIDSIEDAY